MNDFDNLKQRILTNLAEQGIPTIEDPWDIIQRKILAAQGSRKGNRVSGPFLGSSHKFSGSLLTPVPALLLFLLFGIILLASPSGQALAQRILHFFVIAPNDLAVETQTSTDALPPPTIYVTPQPSSLNPVQSTSSDLAACSNQFSSKCSLQQAQSFVDFQLLQFQGLTEGIYFKGALVDNDRVTAMYGCSKECLLWFEQTRADSLPATPATVGSSAHVEIVQWEDIQGEFVAGSYYGDDGSWNSDDGVLTLRWQQGDVVYTISAVQSRGNAEAGLTIGKETLIRLASSLTTGLGQPLNPQYLTSIVDANTLAGFDIVQPDSLPEGYLFSFATYDTRTKFVCLNYTYNGASYPSLFIRQSPTAELTELKGYVGGNFHAAPVSLTKVDGEAIYITGFASPEGACDSEGNVFRAGQALLWRANGMSFEIYAEFPSPYNGAGLEQNELIRLADGLTAKP